MNQYLRLVWCLASIIYLGKASAEDSQICSCLPRAECSLATGGESPCPEPGQVYCCSSPAIAEDTQEFQREILEDSKPDRGTVDSAENADQPGLIMEENDNKRQEKSIRESAKNGLFDNKLNDKKEYDEKREKVFIVYAENGTKQEEVQAKENRLQIVLPVTKQIDDVLMDEDNRDTSTHTYKIEESVKKSTEKLPPTIHVHKSLGGSSKLHRLFPKRRVIPSISKSKESVQNKDDNEEEDMEQSASELDEISMQASSQPSEQTIKPFRAPPRQLARQQVRNESPSHTRNGVHKLLRSRSKNETGVPETQPIIQDLTDEEHVNNADIPKVVVADNINLKVINDLMKNNFSSRQASRTQSNTSPSNNLRLHPSTNIPASEIQEQTTPVTEVMNGIVTRKRLHMRRPLALRTRQQTVSTASSTDRVLMPESTSLKPGLKASRRNPPASRTSGLTAQAQEIQVTTESATQGGGNGPDGKTGQTERPMFGARTSRFRQRPAHARGTVATAASSNVNKEEQAQVPQVMAPVSESKSLEVHYSEQEPSQPVAGETRREMSAKTQDLEISATSDHQSRALPPASFRPPTEMASGFQPIINLQDLKTVGPLPGGFVQQARSFNEDSDGFGLSLPGDAGPQPSTIEPSGDFDYNSMLLPPVFLPRGRAQMTESPPVQTFDDGIDPADLLPPVQLPMPLLREMSREHEALTNIQKEFDVLKSQYDLLLSRYADTLRQYNGEYVKIIESSKTANDSVNN